MKRPKPRKMNADSQCRVMVVDADSVAMVRITRWLQHQHVRVVGASSSAEAKEMLNDVLFIESLFDGLLASHDLPDSSGAHLIQEFQEALPQLSAGLFVAEQSLLMTEWAHTRRVALLQKPLADNALQTWLDDMKVPA